MQIDPTIIPDAAVERLSDLLLGRVGLGGFPFSDAARISRHRAMADILREIIPLLAVPNQPTIVRLDDAADLDEMIPEHVDVHIDRIHGRQFWVGFTRADGTVDHVTIRAKRAMVTMTFQEDC